MGSGKWEVGRGTWDVGRGTWDVGRGTWDVGRGTSDVGRRTSDVGSPSSAFVPIDPDQERFFFTKIESSSMEPGGFALLDGDASVDSGLREIHVPRAWRVYLATGLNFREKKSCCLRPIFDQNRTSSWVDRNPALASASYLATLL